MSFFHKSFENLGETLRTVSLVIGLLVTSITGIGYIYTMISDQKALASEVSSVNARVKVLEQFRTDYQVDRHRIETTEQGVRDINRKFDRFLELMALEGNKKR